MNTATISSRARTVALSGAVGISAFIGTLAAAGPVDAGSADRITITSTPLCSADGTAQGVDLFYDDHADGHVPLSVQELVLRGGPGDGVEEWSGGGLYQENGNYFNRRTLSDLGVEIDPSATYTYSVTISYDDGVTQTGSTSIDLATACDTAPPTTTPPTTTPAPRTDRFVLRTASYGCGTAGGELAYLSWSYQDVPDGHYDVRFDVDVLKNSVVVDHETITTGSSANDGVTAFTEYASDRFPGGPLEPASYSLSIAITYEDGVSEKHVETFNLDDLCDGRVNGEAAPTPSPTTVGPTTTVPGGTLPETGSGDATGVIGALAGVLMTAGAALFAGTRRSRSQ